MRFDAPVYMQIITQGSYNAETGDYEEDFVKETLVFASVTDTGTSTMKLIYDGVKQGSLTVRLQKQYNQPFNYIRIGNKRYKVDLERRPRTKHTFIVSEVQ